MRRCAETLRGRQRGLGLRCAREHHVAHVRRAQIRAQLLGEVLLGRGDGAQRREIMAEERAAMQHQDHPGHQGDQHERRTHPPQLPQNPQQPGPRGPQVAHRKAGRQPRGQHVAGGEGGGGETCDGIKPELRQPLKI